LRSLIFLAASGEAQILLLPDDPFGLPIDEARNIICESMLKTPEAEFLLFIDNDCLFPPGAVKRMVDHDLPYICAGMYTTDVPPRPTIGQYIGHATDGKIHYSWSKYAKKVAHYVWNVQEKDGVDRNDILFPQTKQDLYKIDGSGMHFTLIRRDVIENVDPPWFKTLNTTGAGEDFHFCKKVADAGYPMYADLSVQTGHTAGERYDFGIRELLLVLKYVGLDNLEDDIPPNLIIG